MRLLFLLCSFFLAPGCTKSSPPSAPADPIERGRSVYQANCTACHNGNPKLPGALGPDIAKSSLELVEARVMRAEYPAGYRPKRVSHLMQPLPQLKNDIPALHAYLNSL